MFQRPGKQSMFLASVLCLAFPDSGSQEKTISSSLLFLQYVGERKETRHIAGSQLFLR